VGHHSEAFIGIDTSKSRNAVAIAEGGRGGEVRYFGEFPTTEAATRKLVGKLAAKYGRLTFCYEAGPTGYGLGPIISSAMVAAIGTGATFAKGRDFAAWLGLVPKQISTGDRTILGAISRRGNRYLRVLFVQAAWVVLVRLKNWERYGLKSWIEAAKKRLHHNVLAIALANKLARIAWAVLARGRNFEVRRSNELSPRSA
jgi:Transposase IS116/IS110/IS902 family